MTSDAVFIAKVPAIAKTLIHDFGITDEDAAAILGNAGHESAGLTTFQENGIKPPKGGFGWFQWTGPRRRNFEAYCRRNSLDPKSDKANYAFLFVELTGPEKRAIPALKKAVGLKEKVIAFENAFERAGVKHYASRIAWAEKALTAIRAEFSSSFVNKTPIPARIELLAKPLNEPAKTEPNAVLDAAVKRASAAVAQTAASQRNDMSEPAVTAAKPELDANIRAAIAPVIANATNSEAHFYTKRSFWAQVGSILAGASSLAVFVVDYMQTHTSEDGTSSVSLLGFGFAAWSWYSAFRSGRATTPLGTPSVPKNPVAYRG